MKQELHEIRDFSPRHQHGRTRSAASVQNMVYSAGIKRLSPSGSEARSLAIVIRYERLPLTSGRRAATHTRRSSRVHRPFAPPQSSASSPSQAHSCRRTHPILSGCTALRPRAADGALAGPRHGRSGCRRAGAAAVTT